MEKRVIVVFCLDRSINVGCCYCCNFMNIILNVSLYVGQVISRLAGCLVGYQLLQEFVCPSILATTVYAFS